MENARLLWFVQTISVATAMVLAHDGHVFAEQFPSNTKAIDARQPFRKRIDFIFTRARQRTPSPPGWDEYDGSVYTKERGYGWLSDLSGRGGDGGGKGEMILPDGTRVSPRALGRLELANWQGAHRENRPLVFRIDLPDGWYRVTCTSVESDYAPLPLVDQRSIKFRAHDVVFAGRGYGAPLKVEGNRLIEGSNVVEVTDGHLRIVVGDPAYGGWTWAYEGAWYEGWKSWFGKHNLQRYAGSWYQKLARTVDPGFHSLRFNSLEIERVSAPTRKSSFFFRDFFSRDDSRDINSGIAEINQWSRVRLDPGIPDHIETELYKTALALKGRRKGKDVVGVLQNKVSPERGTIRYATRVSVFTGEGSKIHSGAQEAGLLILGEPVSTSEFNATFIGVAFDQSRAETRGWVKYRVGNGIDRYRTDFEVPDIALPFRVTEGEYEIIVEHDVEANTVTLVQINGADVTNYFAPADRKQRISRGVFGVRAFMDPLNSGVSLRQFYWYYGVERR